VTSKLYRYILIAVFTLFIHSSAYANCSKSYTLGFFNGVWNTRHQASDAKRELQDLIGTTYNNESVKYEAFYNHTGASVDATALQDLAETFIQRSAEIDASGELGKRFEYFWEFLGSSEPTFIDKIKGIFPNALSLFDSLYTSVATKLTSIIFHFLSNPPTETDYATHNAQLDALAADGQKLMLVGHSQGNLFVNHAYDHILPIVTKDRVATAHIAPASPTLRGEYVLANIDLVINTLRLQGGSSVQANNLELNVSKADYSGHMLVGTYLDSTRDGRGRVKTMIETAMGGLKCYKFQFQSKGNCRDAISNHMYMFSDFHNSFVNNTWTDVTINPSYSFSYFNTDQQVSLNSEAGLYVFGDGYYVWYGPNDSRNHVPYYTCKVFFRRVIDNL